MYLNVFSLNPFSNSDNYKSFLNGVATQQRYENDETRRLTSLNACVTGWLTEVLLVILLGITLLLKHYGFRNIFYPFFGFVNITTRVIILPLIQIMNSDEETKNIIREENWYQGMKHTIGIYKKVTPAEIQPIHQEN
jgi:hypothetical protein